MENWKNPVYAEINVGEYSGFCFLLPKEAYGRKSIRIFVEYWIDTEKEPTIVFSVWAAQERACCRHFLYGSKMPAKKKDSYMVDLIREINESDLFESKIISFIEGLDSLRG